MKINDLKFFIIIFLLTNNIVLSQNNHLIDKEPVIKIPVVFHIIYAHDYYKNSINKSILKEVVDKINDNFNNVNSLFINKPYDTLVAKCNIEFYLPSTTVAVSYHYSNRIFYKKGFSKNPKYDKELKKNGYVDSNHFLNIWICPLNDDPIINDIVDGNKAYSTFPDVNNSKNDGIVLDNELFFYFNSEKRRWVHGNPKFTANVITHEIGHWLGLYHIWSNTVLSNGCYVDDGIQDTPKQDGPNIRDFEGTKIDSMKMACNGNELSNYQNFMDYTYSKYSMFTKDQKRKMRYNIYKYRHELLEKPKPIGDKKIVFDNKFHNALEYRLSRFGRNNYKETFTDNYKLIPPGRYLLEIVDKAMHRVIANSLITIQNTHEGIIVSIDRNGCTRWKYIGVRKFYEFSFNRYKLRGKCRATYNSYSRSNYNRQSRNRNNRDTRRKRWEDKSYNDAYKRGEKLYNEGLKRAKDMYNNARKKHR